MTILNTKGQPVEKEQPAEKEYAFGPDDKTPLLIVSEVSVGDDGRKALFLDIMKEELTPLDILQILKIVADQVGPAAMKQAQEQGPAIQTVPASALEDVRKKIKLDK